MEGRNIDGNGWQGRATTITNPLATHYGKGTVNRYKLREKGLGKNSHTHGAMSQTSGLGVESTLRFDSHPKLVYSGQAITVTGRHRR